MAAFLESAILTMDMFLWVTDMAGPSSMPVTELFFADRLENRLVDKERFILLYMTPPELGPHSLGLVYDQQLHRALMAQTIWEIDATKPAAKTEHQWFPLETILSKWIEMFRIGEVATNSKEFSGNNVLGEWQWNSYSNAQINTTVAAIDQLSAAIEARVPSASLLPVSRDKPLFTDVELDAASIPKDCFIRSVLTRVKTPRFRFIAPGLEVPHDAAAFAACQTFAGRLRPPFDWAGREIVRIPPILLFAASGSQTVEFDQEVRSLFLEWEEHPEFQGYRSIPAGLYTTSTTRDDLHAVEDGFHLLPFKLRAHDPSGMGARKSDGSLVKRARSRNCFSMAFSHSVVKRGGRKGWRG